jgi:antitoxin component YwqK of YwqJK toxin-antitoxin module
MDDPNILHIAEIPFPSGAVKFRYSRVLAPDGSRWIRHGLFVQYHENGEVASEGSYVNGLEDGVWRDFHSNGQVASEGRFRNGKEEGLWRFWNAAGHEEPSVSYNLDEDVV